MQNNGNDQGSQESAATTTDAPALEVGDRVFTTKARFGRVARVHAASGEADVQFDDGKSERQKLRQLMFAPTMQELYGTAADCESGKKVIEGRTHAIQREWGNEERRRRDCYRLPRYTAPGGGLSEEGQEAIRSEPAA
jgi:hypothetical protein